MPDTSSGGGKRWLGGSGFWWLVAVLLVANWSITSVTMGAPDRLNVSYTFFTEQVAAGNVETVTSAADTIQGS
jgi:cell division protease FtsH